MHELIYSMQICVTLTNVCFLKSMISINFPKEKYFMQHIHHISNEKVKGNKRFDNDSSQFSLRRV